MFKNKRARRPIGTKTFDGIVTGKYSDAQSRMLVEVTFNVDGYNQIIKKQDYFLGFKTEVGQMVLVEFKTDDRGTIITLKEKK